MTQILLLWGMAAVIMACVMSAAWVVQLRTGQGGWADAFWSFGVGGTGALLSLWPSDESGLSLRQIIVAVLIAIWGLRLGLHITARSLKETEDARYARLREDWGQHYRIKMYGFMLLQAGAASVLLLSVLLAAHNPSASLTLQDIIALSVFVVAVLGEGAADRQLANFKANPANKGKVCHIGLWSWSRHPNYFFEWLGWCAWPVFAISFSGQWPWGWLALSAPVYIYWLLTKVSGIPLLEAHMMRTRPEEFRAYAARTSAFFPRPPRR